MPDQYIKEMTDQMIRNNDRIRAVKGNIEVYSNRAGEMNVRLMETNKKELMQLEQHNNGLRIELDKLQTN